MFKRLALIALLSLACMALAVPGWAGVVSFGVDQSSVKIADAPGGWLATYGPGRNIAVSGSGTEADPTVLHVSFVDTPYPNDSTIKIGYLKGDVDYATGKVFWYRSHTVAEGNFMGNGAHIAVGKNSQGTVVPHLVWADGTYLYYGQPAGTYALGTSSIINTTAVPDEFSRSIAADDNGVVHIAYVGRKNGVDSIYYARSEDSGSTFVETETVVDSCNAYCYGGEPEITVDENGTPMVAYTHYDSSASPQWSMKFAVRGTNGQWSTQTVNASDGTDYYTSVSANGGRVCLAWYDYTPDVVLSACASNGTWSWTTSNITGLPINFRASIALDSNGVASVVGSQSDDLYFAREKNPNSWGTPTVIATGSNIMDPKIVMDATDKANIVFPNYSWYHDLEFTREK